MNANGTMQAERRLVVFEVAGDIYGLDIEKVIRTTLMKCVTAQTMTSDFINGAICYKTGVVPVVNLSSKFGSSHIEYNALNTVVVVNIYGKEIGLMVDTMFGMLRVPLDSLEPLALSETLADWDYLLASNPPKRKMKLLNPENLFSIQERRSLLQRTLDMDRLPELYEIELVRMTAQEFEASMQSLKQNVEGLKQSVDSVFGLSGATKETAN